MLRPAVNALLRPSLLFLLAVALISGCTSNRKDFQPVHAADDGRAAVHVYRPERMSNAVLSPLVMIDGEAVFDTGNGTWTYVYLPPGEHRFVIDPERGFSDNDELKLPVESGNTYYLRIDTSMQFETGKPYTRRFSIVRVDAHQALDEIAQCDYRQAKLPSKYLWPGDMDANGDEEDQPGHEATFSIEKSSNPFGHE